MEPEYQQKRRLAGLIRRGLEIGDAVENPHHYLGTGAYDIALFEPKGSSEPCNQSAQPHPLSVPLEMSDRPPMLGAAEEASAVAEVQP
jgi:hypothetical protein